MRVGQHALPEEEVRGAAQATHEAHQDLPVPRCHQPAVAQPLRDEGAQRVQKERQRGAAHRQDDDRDEFHGDDWCADPEAARPPAERAGSFGVKKANEYRNLE